MKRLRSRAFTLKHPVKFFLSLLLLPIHIATGHNKVVVIPLGSEDAAIKPFAPLAPSSPSMSNYDIPFARPDVAIDLTTGLMWQRSDDGELRTWSEAVDYCSFLNLGASVFGNPAFDDWRLPNLVELQSIVDYSISDPTLINTLVFPGTSGGNSAYWSSSVVPLSTLPVYSVFFGSGNIRWLIPNVANLVRCVR